MPLLAILATAAKIYLRIDAALLEEWYAHCREVWTQRDVETSVAIKEHGVLSIPLHTFLVCNEHRNARSVLAEEEELLTLVILLSELYVRLCIERAFVLVHVVTIDGSRHCKRREGIEALLTILAACETYASRHWQLHFVPHLSIQPIYKGMVAGILRIVQYQLMVYYIHAIQDVLLLGNEFLPLAQSGLIDIRRHDASLGRTIVGIEEYLVALSVYGTVLIVHIVGHLNEL